MVYSPCCHEARGDSSMSSILNVTLSKGITLRKAFSPSLSAKAESLQCILRYMSGGDSTINFGH